MLGAEGSLMLHVFKDHDFIFYHMYKCGGTSVKKMLLRLRLPSEQLGKGHLPLSTYADKVDLDAYRIYANIRNPYARIVSMFEFIRQMKYTRRPQDLPFESFFYDWFMDKKKSKEYPEFSSRQDSLFVGGKLPETLYVIKLEDVDRFWPRIIKRHFDFDVQFVPRFNTTIHQKDTMEYFDADMIKEVKKKEAWAIDQYCLY